MVTDDERREVAARLRSANEHSCSPDCELRYALDGSHGCKGNGCTGCHRDAFDRLADLIDPGDTSLSCRDTVARDLRAGESGQKQDANRDTVTKESPAVQIAPEFDREALLALTVELDKDAERKESLCFDRSVATVGTRYVRDISRRIRKALGVGK